MIGHSTVFAEHDHAHCVSAAVARAEEICAEGGLRLTPMRRRVLEILLEDHRATGAYEVLAKLADEGKSAHPPVAYRALEFLVNAGLAHKVERLNAFVSCVHPDKRHRPAFLICTQCRAVAEADVPHDDGALGNAANELGFRISQTVIEAEGTCPACIEAAT